MDTVLDFADTNSLVCSLLRPIICIEYEVPATHSTDPLLSTEINGLDINFNLNLVSVETNNK